MIPPILPMVPPPGRGERFPLHVHLEYDHHPSPETAPTYQCSSCAIRISDKKKLFVIDFIISAKLPPETDLRAWFDEAHQVIRDEFLAQTTKEAQKQWGLPYSLLEALVDPGPRAEEVVLDFAAHVPGPAVGLFEPARDIS
jgi:hypothetical protein